MVPRGRQAMALGGKGAEMGPKGLRIDCERRSGVGWYAGTSEGQNVQ